MKVLLANGANVNATDKWNKTPLHEATWKGHIEVVKVLLAGGADGNAKNNNSTPLHLASYYGHTEVVKVLLAGGVNVSATS